MNTEILYISLIVGMSILGVFGVEYAKRKGWNKYINEFEYISDLGFYFIKKTGVIKSKNGQTILHLVNDGTKYISILIGKEKLSEIKQIAYNYVINEINRLNLSVDIEDEAVIKCLIDRSVEMLYAKELSKEKVKNVK